MASAGVGRRVEGTHAVRAALAAGRARSISVERRRMAGLADVISAAEEASVEVNVVDDVRPLSETSAPQGIVAECAPLELHSLDDLATAGRPALVVLDHLEDPHNVGAVARTATAAGMTGMIVSSVRSAPLGATAFKAAVGALERLPVAVVSSIPAALQRLRSKGVWIVGLDAESDASLFGLDLLTEPVAIVVGAEGAGLARLVKDSCDVVVSIPMDTATESLNASVAAALASFEVARVRQASG